MNISWRTRRELIAALATVALFGFSLSAVEAQPPSNGLRVNRRSAPQPLAQPAEEEEEVAPVTPREAKVLLHEAFTLSQSSAKIGDLSQIVDLCRRANGMQLAPEEAQYTKNLLAWAYNRRGEMWSEEAASLAKQGYEKEAARVDRKALEDFNAAIRLDANRWKALHNRGVSYGLLGLHDEAVKDFTRVIELKPSHVNAWFNRAEIYLENGRLTSAIRDYSEVMRLEPNDASAVFGRARCMALGKRYDEALADFAHAIKLEPTHTDFRIERGEVFARLGMWKQAAADFRSAIELDGDSARGYRCAAWLMATCPETKFRNAKLALEAAERATTLAERQNEFDYTYLDTLAAAMANAGHFTEAQELLEEALQESPSNVAPVLQHRLALYVAENPYRLPAPRAVGSSSAIRTASTRVQR